MYYNYFVFDGKPSTEFGLIISGNSTWDSPEYDVESTEIVGRHGDILNGDGRFKNFDLNYKGCAIVRDFKDQFPAFRAFILSHCDRYYKLEDTYHPDYYLKAAFKGSLRPTYDAWNDAGSFDLSFNAMPQRWLKSGDNPIEVASGKSIKNPTLYNALPIIRVYGTGRLTVGDISVDISKDYKNPYIDLDCSLYDAYYGNENTNNQITTTDYLFPVLRGGAVTKILFDSTISKVLITPRWWTI